MQYWSIAGEIEVRPQSRVELVLGDQSCRVVYKEQSSLEHRLQSGRNNYSTTGCQAMMERAPDFSEVSKGNQV